MDWDRVRAADGLTNCPVIGRLVCEAAELPGGLAAGLPGRPRAVDGLDSCEMDGPMGGSAGWSTDGSVA